MPRFYTHNGFTVITRYSDVCKVILTSKDYKHQTALTISTIAADRIIKDLQLEEDKDE